MRPNLSLESIAGALAVLGTGILMAACGGEEPAKSPVNANEVSGASDKSATPADGHCGADKAHKTGEGTCKGGAAAGHCGAGTEHKAGEASCSADKKGSSTDAKSADPVTAAKPADTTAAPATPAAAAPATTGTAKKPGAPATPPATPAAAKKGGAGSCGAGTCSAKK